MRRDAPPESPEAALAAVATDVEDSHQPPANGSPGFLRRRLALSSLVLCATLPYLGVLDAPFVFDDVKLVAENDLLRLEGREAFDRFAGAFDITSSRYDEEEVRENYRPLRFLSYWVDYALSKWLLAPFEPDAPPTVFFHLQNVFWHAVNVLLVWGLGRRLLGGSTAPFLLALLFALHPLQTEAVTYVSGRRDVLSTAAFLGALLVVLRTGPREAPRLGGVLLPPLLLIAGFLAKEMVITLAAVVLLVDLARRSRPVPSRLALHGLLWAVTAALIAITLSHRGLVAPAVGGSTGSTLLTAPRFVGRYLGLLLFPLSQSIDYSGPAVAASTSWLSPPSTLPCLALVAALATVSVVALLRRRVVLAVGAGWFLVTLTPVLQIVPIPERFAERFAYLPSIGVLLPLAALLGALVRRERPLGWGAAGLVACLLAGATVARNDDWGSRLGVWGSAARAQPGAARAHLGYANALKDDGRLREAETEYSRALEQWAKESDPLPVHRGLALQARMFRGGVRALLAEREPAWLDRAIDDLEEVLASRDTDGTLIDGSPRYALVQFELAGCLLKAERHEAAVRRFERIIAFGEPARLVAQSWYWLAKCRLLDRDVDGAVERLRRAAASVPEEDPLRGRLQLELADLLLDLKDDPEAAWKLLERSEPRMPSAELRVGARLRMAKILDRKGEVHASIRTLREALRIDPDSAPTRITLAGLEANLGNLDEARAQYEAVLRRDPTNAAAREGLKKLELRRRLSRRPENPEATGREELRGLVSRARAHASRRELVAAREVYGELVRRAAEAGEKDLVSLGYCGIAEAEELLGRAGEAERAYDNALAAAPGRAETLLRAASYRFRTGREPDRARELYRRYFKALEPAEEGDPRAWLQLGYLLVESEPEAAARRLEGARRVGIAEVLGSDAPLVDKRLGYLYARLEKWESSLDAFGRYLDATRGRETEEAERERVNAFVNQNVIPRLIER